MPRYIYRTWPSRTLIIDDKSYRDGDPITLSKADAEALALQSPRNRFEEASSGDVVDMASLDADTAPKAAPVAKS